MEAITGSDRGWSWDIVAGSTRTPSPLKRTSLGGADDVVVVVPPAGACRRCSRSLSLSKWLSLGGTDCCVVGVPRACACRRCRPAGCGTQTGVLPPALRCACARAGAAPTSCPFRWLRGAGRPADGVGAAVAERFCTEILSCGRLEADTNTALVSPRRPCSSGAVFTAVAEPIRNACRRCRGCEGAVVNEIVPSAHRGWGSHVGPPAVAAVSSTGRRGVSPSAVSSTTPASAVRAGWLCEGNSTMATQTGTTFRCGGGRLAGTISSSASAVRPCLVGGVCAPEGTRSGSACRLSGGSEAGAKITSRS